MTRLRGTGDSGEELPDNLDPRKLADEVPRAWGEQRHPEPGGEAVDEHDDGVPTRPARDYS